MKTFFLFLFLSTSLISQTYMNINIGGSYKCAEVDDITEITFSADGTTMTTTTSTIGNSTDAVSGITEITFDETAQGDPLPVELTSFYSQTSDNSVTLFWTTATEINNYGFKLQKSVISNQTSEKEWDRLTAKGFDTGSQDGVVGPKTIAAIRAYQAAHSLAVNGKATKALLAALR